MLKLNFSLIFLFFFLKKSSTQNLVENSVCNIYNGFYSDSALYAGSNFFSWYGKDHEIELGKPFFGGFLEIFGKFTSLDNDFVWELIPVPKMENVFLIKNVKRGKYLYASQKTGILLNNKKRKVFADENLDVNNNVFLWKIESIDSMVDSFYSIINLADKNGLYADTKWFGKAFKNLFIGPFENGFRYRWKLICKEEK